MVEQVEAITLFLRLGKIMKKMKIFISAVLFMCAALFISCGSDYEKDADGLNIEFEQALKIASKNKQNILLFVTMEGDDLFSETIMNNVVRTEDFKSEVMDKYTVVHIDFSQASYGKTAAKVNATKEENKQAEKYAAIMEYNSGVASLLNVNYTPSVYILTQNGYFIAQSMLSDQISSTSDFVKLLNSFNLTVDRMNKLFEKAEKGTSLEKVNAINDIFESTDAQHRVLLSDLVKQVPELDKTNRTGLVSKYLLAAAEDDAIASYQEGNILKAVKAYTDITNEKFIEPAHVQQAYYMAGYLLASSGSNDFDVILNYFKQSYDADPESEIAPTIQNIYDYILTMKAASEKAAEEALQNKQNEAVSSTVFEETETSSDEPEAEASESAE